jgi:hypothetical protein
MRKSILISWILMLVVAGSTWAQGPLHRRAGLPTAEEHGAFRLRLGYFEPTGSSEYWDEVGQYFTGGADDMGDVLGALEYLRRISPRSSLLFTVSFWDGDTAQSYLDWTDDAGFPITHSTTLEMNQLSVAWVLDLARRPGPAVPYVGVGGGLYFWELREEGEFIDFGVDPAEIVLARYQDSGTAPGLFVVGGIEFMVSPGWSVVTEARYHWVQDEVGSGFTGTRSMDLDLSGFEASAGISWRF